jgi:hypothetical protein
MWWIMNASDRYMISFFLGVGANGLYAAAYGMKKNVPYWRANKNRLEPWKDGLICHYLFNY